MTEERVTPLRQRMFEDMRIRGMGDKAQKSRIRAIKDVAALSWAITRHGHAGRSARLSEQHRVCRRPIASLYATMSSAARCA